jgi:hypothetical protein
VITISIIFWDIIPCSLLKVNRHFKRTYFSHQQGTVTSVKAGGKQTAQHYILEGSTQVKVCLFVVSCMSVSASLNVDIHDHLDVLNLIVYS